RTGRHPAYRWPEPRRGGRMEHENLGVDANGEATSGLNHEGESTDAMLRGGLAGSSDEAEECPRGGAGRLSTSEPQRANWQQEEPAALKGGGSSPGWHEPDESRGSSPDL